MSSLPIVHPSRWPTGICAGILNLLAEPTFPAQQGFWVVPAARVVHSGGSSVPHLGESAFIAAFFRNLLRYSRRHHPRRTALVAAAIRTGLLVRALARPARRQAYVAAMRELSGEGSNVGTFER